MAVEKMDVDEVKVEGAAAAAEVKKDPDVLSVEDIREQVKQLEKAVNGKDFRFTLRVLRSLPSTRKKLNQNVLRRLIHRFYSAKETEIVKERDGLIKLVGELEQMDTTEGDEASTTKVAPTPKAPKVNRISSTPPPIPEVDVYLHMLVLIFLIDNNKTKDAREFSEILMNKIMLHNRRSLDLIAAKCYFYFSRAHELDNKLEQIRPVLHARLRTATLRSDYEGQAVLINCLLRNYLHYNLYDQGDKLVSKISNFPEAASNNEWARFLYYLGRIKSIQLDYSEAQRHLVQAFRKAPQQTAVGFKQVLQKLTITVELLLGDIPDRSIFCQDLYKQALAPYFELTQAVRLGNLKDFTAVLVKHQKQFEADKTYILIQRLRHNVIKTGLRAIATSYSKISLADVANKLTLDNPEDAEFIVAKAIKDGVIEATMDHERGFVASKEKTDIYSTQEPQIAFHQRIAFNLNIYNQSVKAMRYPPKSYNKELESAEERREREQQDIELAKEMADDDDDFM